MEQKPIYIVRTWAGRKSTDRVIPEFYETLAGLQASINQAERLVHDEIATAAIALERIEAIRRMIIGRKHYANCEDDRDALENLLDLILEEIGGSNDHNNDAIPPS